jgi:hypothetical protein
LPVTIPSGEGRSIRVVVKLPKRAGAFTRPVSLVVDDGGMVRVQFRVTGRIRPEAAVARGGG